MNDTILIWVIAGAVALLTPILGFLSPFGRTRRSLVADLRDETEELRKKIVGLMAEIVVLKRLVEETELSRVRLERENYRLYREMDGRSEKS